MGLAMSVMACVTLLQALSEKLRAVGFCAGHERLTLGKASVCMTCYVSMSRSCQDVNEHLSVAEDNHGV